MPNLFFLFSDYISLVRMKLILSLTNENQLKDKLELHFYITGEALFSFFNPEIIDIIKKFQKNKNNLIFWVLDGWESQLRGLDFRKIYNTNESNEFFENIDVIGDSPYDFWDHLISQNYSFLNYETSKLSKILHNIGFFQLEGPYMSRSSVYCTRFLKAAANMNKNTELYAYLDGLHMFHSNQNPSEFENIGNLLTKLSKYSNSDEIFLKIMGCSRCAIARGYCMMNSDGFYSPINVIDSVEIINLNEIIERFKHLFPIFSANSGMIYFSILKSNSKTFTFDGSYSLLIVISNSPYHSEWAFGGISFAIACANNGILTKVLFQDKGLFTFIGSTLTDKDFHEPVFNIKEIIEATYDMENLKYYADLNSNLISTSNIRENIEGIGCIDGLPGVQILNDNNLHEIFSISDNYNQIHLGMRIFFF
ncbi:MAG: DsrE family protein [Candidatus Lokiarchaeota archaeon]|nr:DsrE family protein [Candidatus Harpocratesius repetitus]